MLLLIAELAAQGITAKGFSTDLSDPAAVKATVAAVHSELGPISVLFWNPYGDAPAGFLTATPEQLQKEFNLTVVGERSLQSVSPAYRHPDSRYPVP